VKALKKWRGKKSKFKVKNGGEEKNELKGRSLEHIWQFYRRI